jgi:hypothetical protein
MTCSLDPDLSKYDFGFERGTGMSKSKVTLWSGPFLWVGVRVMYPHSVMWIHSSGVAGQR